MDRKQKYVVRSDGWEVTDSDFMNVNSLNIAEEPWHMHRKEIQS